MQGFFAGLLPVERRQLIEPVLVGHPGQALQKVFLKQGETTATMNTLKDEITKIIAR